jgi:hypothetical protein
VTGHYPKFLKATLDEMDKYQKMKEHYFVIDDAPIYSTSDARKYIHPQGY